MGGKLKTTQNLIIIAVILKLKVKIGITHVETLVSCQEHSSLFRNEVM